MNTGAAVPFHYGRGVFETLPVRAGKVRHADWHLQNLLEAARALDLPTSAVQPGPVPSGDGMWRWLLAPDGFTTTWLEGLPPEPATVDLDLSPLRVSALSWEARFKTFSYLLMWQARALAPGGWAVLLNEHEHLAGATMANLFWVRDGRVCTPALACGCRAGTARRWVLECSGLPVEQVQEGPETLDQATEIFLTNARLGVFPVASWRGRPLDRRTGDRLRQRWLDAAPA